MNDIDDQGHEYSIKKPHEFEKTHESWAKENLILDNRKIKNDEIYATYIGKFIQ